jgi:hypothetical protein
MRRSGLPRTWGYPLASKDRAAMRATRHHPLPVEAGNHPWLSAMHAPRGPRRATPMTKRYRYWYASDIYYCPICCSESKYRQRVTDRPRPTKWADRIHIIEAWDYCDSF